MLIKNKDWYLIRFHFKTTEDMQMSVHFGRLRKKQRQCENKHNIFHFFVIIVIPRGTCTPVPSIHSFIHSYLFAVSHIMRHLHISHYCTLFAPPPRPPPSKFCFSLLLGITDVPGEIENNAFAKFWGQIRCIMGDMQVAYYNKVEL